MMEFEPLTKNCLLLRSDVFELRTLFKEGFTLSSNSSVTTPVFGCRLPARHLIWDKAVFGLFWS
jgi:hypothetical protein